MDDNKKWIPGNSAVNGQVDTPQSPTNNGLSSFTMDPGAAGKLNEPAVSLPSPQPSSAPLPNTFGKTIEPPSRDDNDTGESKNVNSSSTDDDLLSIKQQAITQLKPMLGHLDQTPEEKFRTTMMMIQANDDKSLIKDAYAAAQQISDEKAKAQALLDVVNEINYFSQSNNDDGSESET